MHSSLQRDSGGGVKIGSWALQRRWRVELAGRRSTSAIGDRQLRESLGELRKAGAVLGQLWRVSSSVAESQAGRRLGEREAERAKRRARVQAVRGPASQLRSCLETAFRLRTETNRPIRCGLLAQPILNFGLLPEILDA